MPFNVSYILIAILFFFLIFLDISKKINLTNKLFMGLLLIIAPHIVLVADFISRMQSIISTSCLAIICILFVIYIWIKVNVLPHNKKLIDDFRIRVLLGGRRLILYSLYASIAQIPFYILLQRFLKATIHSHIFVLDIIVTVIFIGSLYLNGIIRILFTSRQLNIIKKAIILFNMWIPVVNLFFIVYLGSITKSEYKREYYRILNRDVRVDSAVCQTRYPLFMVHGAGFKDLRYFNYWGRIPGELKRHGATIYYGNQEAWATIEDNAEFLKERVLEIIQNTGCEKVNIIAHSKGGLDARYMISMLGMSNYVASLTTFATPHRGSKLIDIIYKLPKPIFNMIGKGLNRYFRLLGDKKPDIFTATEQLSNNFCEKFNKQVKNAEGVYYQSYATVMNNIFSDYILTIPYLMLRLTEGKNDGLVSIESSKWGEFKGVLSTKHSRGISHGDIIDLRRNDYEGFDAREKYVEIVSELKNMGL